MRVRFQPAQVTASGPIVNAFGRNAQRRAVNQGAEERIARAASPANRFFFIYVIATTPERSGTGQRSWQ
jgi:hypothetical protein